MRKSISINIPEPCHEDWNKMTSKAQGRHCASCKKTVFDFTDKTDEQIIKTFEANGKLCGRFKNQQLNREIVLARKDKNNYLSWAASGLFAFMALGQQNAYAQDNPQTVQTDSLKRPHIKGKIATSILKESVISGTVTTAEDNLPLPGASVIIKGTAKGAQTDFDGNYKIKAKVGDILVISYVGMESVEITLGINSKYNVSLENQILGEIVVVGGMVAVTQNTHHCNISEDYEPILYATESEQRKSNEIKKQNQKWRERNKAQRNKWKTERKTKRQAVKNGEQKRTLLGKFFYSIKTLFSKK